MAIFLGLIAPRGSLLSLGLRRKPGQSESMMTMSSSTFVNSSAKLVSILVSIMLASCTTADQTSSPIRAPRNPEWMPFEKIHPAIRESLSLRSGDSVQSCGNIVASGRLMHTVEGGEVRIWEPVLTDEVSNYFNNRTGKKIDTCEFVTAVRNPNQKDNCPPREWKCTWK